MFFLRSKWGEDQKKLLFATVLQYASYLLLKLYQLGGLRMIDYCKWLELRFILSNFSACYCLESQKVFTSIFLGNVLAFQSKLLETGFVDAHKTDLLIKTTLRINPGGAFDCDRDSTWIWTLTKGPICTTEIFKNSRPFGMNFKKFCNHVYKFCRFENANSEKATHLKVKNRPICREFQVKNPPIWAAHPVSLNNQVHPLGN